MANSTPATDLYLDLVKRVLMRENFERPLREPEARGWKGRAVKLGQHALAPLGAKLVSSRPVGFAGETMLSRARLDNLQACVEQVLLDGVPGDLIETGVWRGGATILMRAVLAAHDISDRTVWLADSFEGFPSEDRREQAIDRQVDFTAGMGDDLFRVDAETVRRNFSRFGLLDDQVQFLVGWFSETLPGAPIDQLAVMRLDGDMYASTRDALEALYPKLSIGGFVIVDDYNFHEPCRRAVDEFRSANSITDVIHPVDDEGVFWRHST
jgi:hypothetical protein